MLSNYTRVDVIGAPLDRGAALRGVDMGPNAMRNAGLVEALLDLGLNCRDIGDVRVSQSLKEAVDDEAEKTGILRHMPLVNNINERLYNKVLSILEARHFPLILGGDHAISAGSVMAMQKHYGRIGLIWMDAHGDFNDAMTSPSGNMHGMSLSAVTGFGPHEMLPFKEDGTAFVNPRNVVQIGARELDTEEKKRLKKSGVTVFSMTDIDRLGMYEVVKRAITIAGFDTAGIQISWDLDCIDPTYAPGVGTPVNGGITYREAHLACELLAESGLVRCVEIVELNPILDEYNKTGKIAVELIASLLGKTII